MRYVLSIAVALLMVSGPLLAQDAGKERPRFESMGIGGGGHMYCPTVSPFDSKVLIIQCDMGGFYVSEDDAKSWRVSFWDDIRGSCTCRPAFHPKEPSTIFLPYEDEIRVSRDLGRTWTTFCKCGDWLRSKSKLVGAWAINFDPDDPDRFFVSTVNGLYRTTDAGKTFAKCEGVPGEVRWVHVTPTGDPKSRLCIAGSSEGVFVSRDNGTTWTKKGKGVDEPLVGFVAATDPKTGRTCCYGTSKKSVFYSNDGGETFAKAQGLPQGMVWQFCSTAETTPDVCYVSNWGYHQGTWGVFKTVDGGRTWKKVFRPRDKEDCNVRWSWIALNLGKSWGGWATGFAVSPADPDVALFSNAGELFVTRDGGRTWVEESSVCMGDDPAHPKKDDRWSGKGLEVAGLGELLFDPLDHDRVYAGFGDIGLLISDDHGKSWRKGGLVGIPEPWQNTVRPILCDPDRKGVMYAAASREHGAGGWFAIEKYGKGGGVVVSADRGETWKVLGTGQPEGFPCTDLVLDPKSPADARVLYACYYGEGVYRSDDGGKTWTKKSKGLGRPENMHCLDLELTKDGTLFCTVCGKRKGYDFGPPGGVWKSTDRGETWTEITKCATIWWPRALAVDPRDSNRILLAACAATHKSGGGLWETVDGGKHWTLRLAPKDLVRVKQGFIHSSTPQFHPANPDVIYYFTSTHGLYLTVDNGKTWKRIRGLPPVSTMKVVFDPDDPDVAYFLGSGSGIWKGPAKGY